MVQKPCIGNYSGKIKLSEQFYRNGHCSLKISIEYCAVWNYEPRALRVRERLGELIQADINLVAGGGGVFDITVDGQLVFSKKSEGRFPTDDDLQSLAVNLA